MFASASKGLQVEKYARFFAMWSVAPVRHIQVGCAGFDDVDEGAQSCASEIQIGNAGGGASTTCLIVVVWTYKFLQPFWRCTA